MYHVTYILFIAHDPGTHPQILESDWLNSMEDILLQSRERNSFHNQYVIL